MKIIDIEKYSVVVSRKLIENDIKNLIQYDLMNSIFN